MKSAEVRPAALALPVNERAKLARELLESVEPGRRGVSAVSRQPAEGPAVRGCSKQQRSAVSDPPDVEILSLDDFWRELTVEKLAEDQGIRAPQRLCEVFGAAADLWEDDADAEAFVVEIYERRRERREREMGEG